MKLKYLDVYRAQPLRTSFKTPLFSRQLWIEILVALLIITFVVGLAVGLAIDYSIVFPKHP